MKDAELSKRLDDIEGYIEVLAKVVADQMNEVQAMRAHQQAHFAELRDLISKTTGEPKNMLNQRLKAAYQAALKEYAVRYAAFQQDGDVNKLLDRAPTPDDMQDN